MEAERALERANPDAGGYPVDDVPPAPAGEKGASPRVATNLSRCPYCHEEVRSESADWLACEGCLARHHTSCWTEHGSCATCHSRGALRRGGGARSWSSRAAAAVALVLGFVGLLGVRYYVERSELKAMEANLVDLPVAARDLHVGDVVGEKDIGVRKFPRATLEALGRYMDDVKVIEGGKVCVAEIKQGEVFTQKDFRRAAVRPDDAVLLSRATVARQLVLYNDYHDTPRFTQVCIDEAESCERAGRPEAANQLRAVARVAIQAGTEGSAGPTAAAKLFKSQDEGAKPEVVKPEVAKPDALDEAAEKELAGKLDMGQLAQIKEKQAVEVLTMQVVFEDQGTADPKQVALDRGQVAGELIEAAKYYTKAGRLDDAKRVVGASGSLVQGKPFEVVLKELGATK